MTQVIKLDTEDVKKIIAEHFHIDEKQIIKTQYSYLVEGVPMPEKGEE